MRMPYAREFCHVLHHVYEMLHFSWPPEDDDAPDVEAATVAAWAVSAWWINAATSENIARHCGHTSRPPDPALGLDVRSMGREAGDEALCREGAGVPFSGCALLTWAINWDTYANFFWQIGHSSELVVIRFADAALAEAAAVYEIEDSKAHLVPLTTLVAACLAFCCSFAVDGAAFVDDDDLRFAVVFELLCVLVNPASDHDCCCCWRNWIRIREDLSTLRGRAPRFLLLLLRSPRRIRPAERLAVAATPTAVAAAHVVLPHDVDVLLERPVQRRIAERTRDDAAVLAAGQWALVRVVRAVLQAEDALAAVARERQEVHLVARAYGAVRANVH
ncbi:hypothetical protein FI667_g6855, partial [Globisporangium splendens]